MQNKIRLNLVKETGSKRQLVLSKKYDTSKAKTNEQSVDSTEKRAELISKIKMAKEASLNTFKPKSS